MVLAAGVLDDYSKDVLTVVGVVTPLTLAVLAVLVACWQVFQGFQWINRIDEIKRELFAARGEIATLKRGVEFNRIYSGIVSGLAENLSSVDAIQEMRLAKIEDVIEASWRGQPALAAKKGELLVDYLRLVDELALLSRKPEKRDAAALSLGAGGGNMNTLFLLHELAGLLDGRDADAFWRGVGMIRERQIATEKSFRDRGNGAAQDKQHNPRT